MLIVDIEVSYRKYKTSFDTAKQIVKIIALRLLGKKLKMCFSMPFHVLKDNKKARGRNPHAFAYIIDLTFS